jgi:hypothetical protein
VVAESVANPPNLDVALSSRASEATLSAIKSKTDNIDVALSTRASESTLSAIAGALASRATDRLRVSVVDALPESPLNLVKVAGAALTARDWSSDFARLQNIDVALSSFVGTPGTGPPGRGVVLLGYDGTYLRLIRTTADGKLLAQLG